MNPVHNEQVQQHVGGQMESPSAEGPSGLSMSAPAFQLQASTSVVQRATPGANYGRGNRPDPSNSVGGAEIVSSEGRIANVGDSVRFTVQGASGYSSITWSVNNDLTYSPGSSLPATFRSRQTGPSITLNAGIQGVHTIRATVTPTGGSPYDLTFRLNVEPEDRDYADISSVTPSALANMNDFIALVERVERAYSTLAWQDVASKIRMEHYPGRGGRYGGVIRAFTWDDLIDEQDEVAPLQVPPVAASDVAALRRTQEVSHNGQRIDIGHVMTGLDSMNFPSTAGIFSNHHMSGPAAATWSGDVGSALVNWAVSAPGNDFTAATMTRFYDDFASLTDLLGDYDGINIGGMPGLPASASLSQRLRQYYVTSANTGASRRYHNFCAVSGFDVANGRLTAAARAYIRQQILNFAHGFNVKGSILDAIIMSGGGMGGMGGGYVAPQTMEVTSRYRIDNNIDWFANRFIADVEAGLASEP